jgi:hypothetical protein
VQDGTSMAARLAAGNSGGHSLTWSKKKRQLGDYNFYEKEDADQAEEPNDRKSNLWLHIGEFLVAVVVSVVIHTMSFENGG